MIGLYVLIAHSLYLALAIWVTFKATRFAARRNGSVVGASVALLSLTIFALIPVWDELLTLPRYYELCEKEAGIKIYGKMALTTEFYSDTGEPLFVRKNGDIDGLFNKRDMDDRTNMYKYVRFYSNDTKIEGLVEIRKFLNCVARTDDQTDLLCRTSFAWGSGGWWRQMFFFAFVDPSPCFPVMDYRSLHKEVFEPKSSNLQSHQ